MSETDHSDHHHHDHEHDHDHGHHDHPQPDEAGEGAQALFKTLKLGFFCLQGVMVLLFVIYFVSGMFVVKQNEQAFILRFGKLKGDTREAQIIESGNWNWAFPKPIDQVIKRPVNATKTIRTNHFWYNDPNNGLGGQQGEPPPPEPGQGLQTGTDGYLVTGDQNILHSKWSLTYIISDVIAYHVTCENAEQVIRNAFETVILKEVASAPIDNALYGKAEELRLAVEEATVRAIGKLNVGVQVQAVRYEQREPPKFSIAAFRAVTEAEQQKSAKINEAKGYANRISQEAVGESGRIISEAESYKKRVVAAVQADKLYFNEVLGAYKRSPDTMLMMLHSEALTEVLEQVSNKYIVHPGQEIRLNVGPEPKKIGEEKEDDKRPGH